MFVVAKGLNTSLQAGELKTITQEEACAWLQKYTHPGKHYRKLSIEVIWVELWLPDCFPAGCLDAWYFV